MPTNYNAIIESEIKPLVKNCDWESPDPGQEYFGANQLIAAYEAGVAKGIMGAEKLLWEKIHQNIEKAGTDTKKLIDQLKQKGLDLISARLRVISWDQYEVLVTLSEKQFVGEEFEMSYDIVSELENSSREEHYCISFRFCPEVKGFEEQRVKADGFILTHKALSK
jgi:hypothetical protein